MKTDGRKIEVLYTPRSLGIFLLQYFAIAPLSTALAIIIIVAMSDAHTNYNDIAILLVCFILPMLLAGFFMLYWPHKYRTRLVFDYNMNLLIKIKRGAESQQFNFSDVKSIVSKTVKTIPGCKFYLTIENSPEHSTNIFEEAPPFGAKHWEALAEKLSNITSLPLKKEYYLEQLDGPLLMKSLDERTADRRYGLIMLFIPLIIAFIGAVIYKNYETFRVFVLVGSVTVAFNISLTFLYGFLNRDKFGSFGKNDFIMIVYNLTLLIPFALYYLFFTWLLSGFRWPLSI